MRKTTVARMLKTAVALSLLISSNTLGSVPGLLRVSQANPRYFVTLDDPTRVIFLAGTQTWLTLRDMCRAPSISQVTPFNWTGYVNFLTEQKHNFTKLRSWSNDWNNNHSSATDYRFGPYSLFKRTGPGTGLDGEPKFNLDSLDQRYFDRLKERVDTLNARGIYVTIQIFEGWSVSDVCKGSSCGQAPIRGEPFHVANNVQGLGFADAGGIFCQELPPQGGSQKVLTYQIQYLKKLIDEVNDFDNIIWEICNEAASNSQDWQYAMIDTIKNYELRKPKQHPICMGIEYPGGDNSETLQANRNNHASTNSKNYATQVNNDTVKVIMTDTDHICGICLGGPWVYQSFCNGVGSIAYMDPWDGRDYPDIPPGYDSAASIWVGARKAMGQVQVLANRLNVIDMRPTPSLSSTGYCLSGNKKWIVYQPGSGLFTVNVSSTQDSLNVEWLNPQTGNISIGQKLAGGSSSRNMTPPFGGSALLTLYAELDPPLPVQIISFTGVPTGMRSVKLEWVTISEVNNYGFNLQRRVNNEQSFTELAGSFIPGHGTTNIPQYYSYTDSNAEQGTAYYRLKQIDLDGMIHYSDVIRVDVMTIVRENTPLAYSLEQNYPNPFNPTTTIKYSLPRQSHVRLQLFNLLGELVSTLEDQVRPAGTYEASFDADRMPGGVYLYRLLAGGFATSKKLLLLK